MKRITLLLSSLMMICAAMAQVTQDSINHLQEEVNRKQRDIHAIAHALSRHASSASISNSSSN